MEKYIFLDIDGVLNSYEVCEINKEKYNTKNGFGGYFNEKDNITIENVLWGEELVNNLKLIVNQTNAKIIIISTWRLNFSLSKFKEMFSLYNWNNCPIIDLTPTNGKKFLLTDIYIGLTRGKEIEIWLNFNGGNNYKYVIIDDNDQFLDYQKDYFIQTNMEYGLTINDSKKAIEILNS